MARRGRKVTRRRKKAMPSILGFAEAYAQGNLITSNLFNSNPISFLVGDIRGTGFSTSGGTSLIELIRDPQKLDSIAQSRFNVENIATLAVQSAILNFGFKTAKRALRRPINMVNRTVFAPLALGVKL
jgi:hypothetical protein